MIYRFMNRLADRIGDKPAFAIFIAAAFVLMAGLAALATRLHL